MLIILKKLKNKLTNQTNKRKLDMKKISYGIKRVIKWIIKLI